MLLRSRALLALWQRGHTIEKLLQPGVMTARVSWG
jgi:hypothetical protein